MKRKGRIFCVLLAVFVFAGCTQQAQQDSSDISSAVVDEKDEPAAEQEGVHTIAVGEWLVEPYLEAARIIGMQDDVAVLDEQQVFSHFAVQQTEGGGWRYLNAVTGRIFPENEMSMRKVGTFEGNLFAPEEVEYLKQDAYAKAFFQAEGIGVGFGGHGTAQIFPPIWAGNQWCEVEYIESSLESMAQYCSKIGQDVDEYWRLRKFNEAANLASVIDVENGNWTKTAPEVWQYSGQYKFDKPFLEISDSQYPDQKYILVDAEGNRLNDGTYELALPYHDGVSAVYAEGKWGYVNSEGKPVTEFCYEPIMPIVRNKYIASMEPVLTEPLLPYSANEGLIAVKKDGLCGVIDTQGNEVVACQYEDITPVYAGRVWAKEDGKWGVLNVVESIDLNDEAEKELYRKISEEMPLQTPTMTILDKPEPVTAEEVADVVDLFPKGYIVVGKLSLSNKIMTDQSKTPMDLSGRFLPDELESTSVLGSTAVKNPAISSYLGTTMLCEKDGVLYFAKPFGFSMVTFDRVYQTDECMTAEGQSVYLARGEYQNGGFELSPDGSVPVIVDKNGEIKITEEEYQALYDAYRAADQRALKECLESLSQKYGIRFAQTLIKNDNQNDSVRMVVFDGTSQQIQATEEQKQGATQTFRNYYISYLGAINELDGSLTDYCSDSQRARQEERIWRFNKDHTFENQALLMDESSFVMSNENGVLTARFYVRCENRCWLREDGVEQELNVALQQVTAEYDEEEKTWYIASSILNNQTPINEDALKNI